MSAFLVAFVDGYEFELGEMPKKVRNAFEKTVKPALREYPIDHNHPQIKKLAGYDDFWRFRVSDDYRLVYWVDHKRREVTLLMIGHRGKIYDRLGANEKGEPGARIVAMAPELLETEQTAQEIGKAELELEYEEENAPLIDAGAVTITPETIVDTLSEMGMTP